MKKIFILLFGIAVLAIACEDDDAEIVIEQPKELCDSLDILYSNDIAPILADAGCSGDYCHGGGAAGYTMSDYATTKASAEDSKFLKAIKHETGVSPMPKGRDKLTDEDIQKIECWIQNGYRE